MSWFTELLAESPDLIMFGGSCPSCRAVHQRPGPGRGGAAGPGSGGLAQGAGEVAGVAGGQAEAEEGQSPGQRRHGARRRGGGAGRAERGPGGPPYLPLLQGTTHSVLIFW